MKNVGSSFAPQQPQVKKRNGTGESHRIAAVEGLGYGGGVVVLITGGAGFIGAALTRRLLQDALDVVVVDTAPAWRLDGADIESLPGTLRVESVDVRDAAGVAALVASVDRVFHLAALGSTDDVVSRPDDVLDVNIGGTRTVLAACARLGRPVILASADHHASRAAAEAWASALARTAGLRHATVRYFNVFGPSMGSPGRGRLVGELLDAIRAGQPLQLSGGGRESASFCFVSDAVEATIRLGDALATGHDVTGQTFDIARDEPVTVADLAGRMARLSAHGPGVARVAAAGPGAADVEALQRGRPDVSRARESFGFEAAVSLDDGLVTTLASADLLSDTPAPQPEASGLLRAIVPQIEPDAQLMARIEELLRSGHVTNDGPELVAFERDLSAWLGVEDVVAMGSGSAALHLGLHASVGGRSGACVLPAFTYVATLSAVRHVGLEPVLCDIDPDTWTLDPDALAEILERRSDVVAIVPVTAFGVPPDLRRIRALADQAGAALVLDNAHGVGTVRDGVRMPIEPDVQAFSVHATKVLPAVEGGFAVARDARVRAELRRLRAHGLDRSVAPSDPQYWRPGYNGRLDEVRAAVGRHSLRRLDAVIARRRSVCKRLRAHLSACGGAFQIQKIPAGVEPNGQDLAVLWRGQASLAEAIAGLAAHGVEARRYFHPVLNALDAWRDVRLPVTDDVAERVICLPLYSRMTESMLVRLETATAAVADESGGPA